MIIWYRISYIRQPSNVKQKLDQNQIENNAPRPWAGYVCVPTLPNAMEGESAGGLAPSLKNIESTISYIGYYISSIYHKKYRTSATLLTVSRTMDDAAAGGSAPSTF